MVSHLVETMEIIDQVRDFVKRECQKPSSHYGYEPFPNHFVPMVNYAQQLAEELGADREIVTIRPGYMIVSLSSMDARITM